MRKCVLWSGGVAQVQSEIDFPSQYALLSARPQFAEANAPNQVRLFLRTARRLAAIFACDFWVAFDRHV